MTGNADLLTAFWINVLTVVVLLTLFVIFKSQRSNSRVYFPRWFVIGQEDRVNEFVNFGEEKQDGKARSCVNLNWRTYFHSMDWVWSTRRMSEAELIKLVGLDYVAFLRSLLLGLKLFVPMMIWGAVVLVPLNMTDNRLKTYGPLDGKRFSKFDELSIANVEDFSKWLWAHLFTGYMYTLWTWFLLYHEYYTVEHLWLEFSSAQIRKPDQFTVLVRQVPKDKTKSVGKKIQEFMQENHSRHYISHQVVYKADRLTKLVEKKETFETKLERMYDRLIATPRATRPTVKKHWYQMTRGRVDAIDYHEGALEKLIKEIKEERKKVLAEKFVMTAGFVSFNTRWGAAVCAQTQQTRDTTKWFTEWAPEPADVYWKSLAYNYVEITLRKLVSNAITCAMVMFFFIPVAFVQSVANLSVLNKDVPFLRPLTHTKLARSFIQGYLPALLLRMFLLLLPLVLEFLTKLEGHVSYSQISKYTCFKYHVFLVVNVFFGNILIGSVFEQMKHYIAAPTTIPADFGHFMPLKGTFFVTYIMVDGWTSCAAEVCRIWSLLWYHLANYLFVRTEKERVKITPATPADLNVILPRVLLYFLIGLVYSIISPLILPFLCVYFSFGYVVYRHQVINVYKCRYEKGARLWPYVHTNIVIALFIQQIALIGLFSVKRALMCALFLLPLPVLTLLFHVYCTKKFYPSFLNYPLQEASRKDKMETGVDVKSFVETAYLHPSIKAAPVGSDSDDDAETLRNGIAPSESQNFRNSLHQRSIRYERNLSRRCASGELDSISNLWNSSPGTRPSHREGSDSILASHRRGSNRLHDAGDRSAYFEAVSGFSSPAASRGSSSRYSEGASVLSSPIWDEHLRASFTSFRDLTAAERVITILGSPGSQFLTQHIYCNNDGTQSASETHSFASEPDTVRNQQTEEISGHLEP